MSERTKKFEEKLDDLIRRGELLDVAIKYDCYPEEIKQQLEYIFGKEEAKEYIKLLPNFKREYQSWYSESLALVKQVLPDRISDFSSYYEHPRVRKDITSLNYMIRDYLQGLRITGVMGDIVADGSAAIPEFEQQLNIVRAAKRSLESILIDLTSILQADLFDSEIDGTRALAKAGFLRPAGVICGVVIEKHLRHVCDTHGIKIIKKRPTISDFNDKLKDGNIILVSQWRFIQHLADLRNLCSHLRERDPTDEDVEDLISGTEKILKTVF